MKNYLLESGLKPGQQILVHTSFSRIKEAFPGITPIEVIDILKEIITPTGSIIFPAFTYCFKKATGEFGVFDRDTSPSNVGILSETFRKSSGVTRTSSPTHSFSLWGKAACLINYTNSPASPLGKGSVIEWIASVDDSYVLMIGVNFSALTLGHYIETALGLHYLNVSPWNYLNVLPIGVSAKEEQALVEVPGCSKAFTRFEDYLLKQDIIKKFIKNGLESYLIPIKHLVLCGRDFLESEPKGLLCEQGTCRSCDERHVYLKNNLIPNR
ncbi:MAG: AAC(3) family N-acetyltransferase [Ignavibacteriales bacterium]